MAEAVSLGNCYPFPRQLCKIREYSGTIVHTRASYPEVRKRRVAMATGQESGQWPEGGAPVKGLA